MEYSVTKKDGGKFVLVCIFINVTSSIGDINTDF